MRRAASPLITTPSRSGSFELARAGGDLFAMVMDLADRFAEHARARVVDVADARLVADELLVVHALGDGAHTLRVRALGEVEGKRSERDPLLEEREEVERCNVPRRDREALRLERLREDSARQAEL